MLSMDGDFKNSFGYLLHKMVLLMDRSVDLDLNRELQISYPQFLMLMAIDQNQQTSQAGVADFLCTTQAAVSRQIENLVSKNLVIRHEDEHNRRQNQLRLTSDGEKLIARAYQLISRKSDSLFRVLSEQEHMQFSQILTKLIGEISDIIQTESPNDKSLS
ncbi:MAG: hypothetical protein OHK0017_00700 [Patescibacteria group bacterium]